MPRKGHQLGLHEAAVEWASRSLAVLPGMASDKRVHVSPTLSARSAPPLSSQTEGRSQRPGEALLAWL